MARLLTIISLVLAVLLFPPAALALISNNAVPGDRTYPIKRGLEDVIFSIASINPVTKAMFSAARSDRRFQELNVLVTQGKQTRETLNELVEQTQTTADQIKKVTDQTEKEKLVQQLSASIEKYDKGLEKLSTVSTPTTVFSSPTPTAVINQSAEPTFSPNSAPSPYVSPTPSATIKPTAAPRPTPTSRSTPTPTATVTPHPTPTPRPSPTPTLPPPPIEPSPCDSIADPIQRARCELQRINLNLRVRLLDEFPTPSPTMTPETTNRRGKDQNRDEKRDNSGRNSDKENNGNRRQGRDD